VGIGSNKVQKCKPYPEHIDHHAQVVKELKERDEHDKLQVRKVAKRSLESGQVVWINTFFNPCPTLKWMTLEVVLLSCSASVCEHNWSIEGWIH
jgi:hypothetical protein